MSHDPTWGNPEAWCEDGRHYTTAYDSHGECTEHGCEVTEEREEA